MKSVPSAKKEIKKIRKSAVVKKVSKKLSSLEDFAKVAYGETAGLYPQKQKDAGPRASIYDRKTWDKKSFADLQAARANIVSVAERNSNVGTKEPGKGLIAQQAWRDTLDAASYAKKHPYPGNHFFLRNKDDKTQKIPSWANDKYLIVGYGPFRNVGGGDVKKGRNVYVEIYQV